VPLQEQHHLFDLLLLDPGIADHPGAVLAHAGHLQHAPGRAVEDVERFGAEVLDDALGGDRPHAFDHAAAQVALDRLDAGGPDLRHRVGAELPPEFGVRGPFAFQADALAGLDLRHGAHHGHELVAAQLELFGPQAQHTIIRLCVIVGDAFDRSA